MENSDKRVVLVTGANRGLGLETVRQLREHGFDVWLSSRTGAPGEKAALAVGARYVRLDVTDQASISDAAEYIHAESGRIDILVNNAGISMDGFNEGVARGTLTTNLYGAIWVSDGMLPLMPDGSTIVMVSSGMGSLASFSEDLRRRFLAEDLTRDDLDALMEEFVAAVEDGTYSKKGWPGAAYSVSKAAMNAFTRILSRELSGRGVIVNSVSPGWVRTDMGGAGATRSLDEGGRSIVWAALLEGPDGPTGGFYRDGEELEW